MTPLCASSAKPSMPPRWCVVNDDKLAAEAARRRRQLRGEEERHEATRTALRDANRLLLRLALRDHLREPGDFVIFIGGLDVVLDEVGRLDWSRVELLLGELLVERPHLATPNSEPPTPFHVDGLS